MKSQTMPFPKPKRIPDWRKTPIRELPAAIESCPFRSRGLLRDGWWKRAEPPELRERFAGRRGSGGRYGRDGGTTASAIEAYQHEEEKSKLEDSDRDWENYLPGDKEDLQRWSESLPIKLEVTPASRPLHDCLRAFVARYRDRRFDELSENAKTAISRLVRTLYEQNLIGE